MAGRLAARALHQVLFFARRLPRRAAGAGAYRHRLLQQLHEIRQDRRTAAADAAGLRDYTDSAPGRRQRRMGACPGRRPEILALAATLTGTRRAIENPLIFNAL